MFADSLESFVSGSSEVQVWLAPATINLINPVPSGAGRSFSNVVKGFAGQEIAKNRSVNISLCLGIEQRFWASIHGKMEMMAN